MIVEVLLIVLVTLILALSWSENKQSNLPPGPWRIPFIGRIPHIRLGSCIKDREKYGDMFMYHYGNGRFLYITDYKLAKEALGRIEFADRPKFSFMRIFDEEIEQGRVNGLVLNNGPHWQHNRRFLLQHLRDLGMGKSKLEGIILSEIELLIEDFMTLTDKPTSLPFSINVCILNVIWKLVAGQRYDFKDVRVKELMDTIHNAQESFGARAVLEHFPILGVILPESLQRLIFKTGIIRAAAKKFRNIVQDQIDAHIKNLDPENPADIIDEYLAEMDSEKQDPRYTHFCHADLTRITFDLFVAGNETTSSMIHWVLIYMANFPKVQDKIQEIIDEFVPPERVPGLEQREKLGYLDAAVNEVSRHCLFVTFGILRATNTDVTFNGYFIPKGTVVSSVPGISHMDPAYWKNPEEFDPTRFLDENGKFCLPRDGFQPFGIGKRQCLGENFARMELFLIIAALLQKFRFTPAEGEKMNHVPKRIPFANLPDLNVKYLIKLR